MSISEQHFVEATATARIDERAVALPHAELWGNVQLKGESLIRDFASMHDDAVAVDSILTRAARMRNHARAVRSFIMGNAEVGGSSLVTDSVIAETAVVTDNAHVGRSIISGNARIGESARVVNAYVDDEVVIRGTTSLIPRHDSPVHIAGTTFMHEGLWNRAPRYVELSSGFHITECIHGKLVIGCQCATVTKWLKTASTYGRRIGFTDEQIDEYMEAIRSFR